MQEMNQITQITLQGQKAKAINKKYNVIPPPNDEVKKTDTTYASNPVLTY